MCTVCCQPLPVYLLACLRCHRFSKVLDVSDFCKQGVSVPLAPGASFKPPEMSSSTLLIGKPKPVQAHSRYHLMAVVRHLGGPDSGHYDTFRRVPAWLPVDASGHPMQPCHRSASSASMSTVASCDSASVGSSRDPASPSSAVGSTEPEFQWVRVSDSLVEPVDEAEVLSCEAYMMYYVRGDVCASDATAMTVPSWREEPAAYWYPI